MIRRNSFKGGSGSGQKITIRLLDDNEVIQVDFQSHHKGQFLMDYVCRQLNIAEKDYFGLRYVDSSKQRHWLDLGKSILKQLKEMTPYIVCVRFKFYPCDPILLKEEVSRYQLVLQLRRDILHGRLYSTLSDMATLASFVIQSELGDYNPDVHRGNYVAEFELVSRQSSELEEKVMDLHQKLKGLTPIESDVLFLKKAATLDTYGVDPHPVKDQQGDQLYLGINHTGISTFQGSKKSTHFKWSQITKLNYEAKMFIVHLSIAEDSRTKKKETVGFKCQTSSSCKYLWRCAVEQRLFYNCGCTTDIPTSVRGGGIFGSRFRYSGRVQREILEDPGPLRVSDLAIQRTPLYRSLQRNKTRSLPHSPLQLGYGSLPRSNHSAPPHESTRLEGALGTLGSSTSLPLSTLSSPYCPDHQLPLLETLQEDSPRGDDKDDDDMSSSDEIDKRLKEQEATESSTLYLSTTTSSNETPTTTTSTTESELFVVTTTTSPLLFERSTSYQSQSSSASSPALVSIIEENESDTTTGSEPEEDKYYKKKKYDDDDGRDGGYIITEYDDDDDDDDDDKVFIEPSKFSIIIDEKQPQRRRGVFSFESSSSSSLTNGHIPTTTTNQFKIPEFRAPLLKIKAIHEEITQVEFQKSNAVEPVNDEKETKTEIILPPVSSSSSLFIMENHICKNNIIHMETCVDDDDHAGVTMGLNLNHIDSNANTVVNLKLNDTTTTTTTTTTPSSISTVSTTTSTTATSTTTSTTTTTTTSSPPDSISVKSDFIPSFHQQQQQQQQEQDDGYEIVPNDSEHLLRESRINQIGSQCQTPITPTSSPIISIQQQKQQQQTTTTTSSTTGPPNAPTTYISTSNQQMLKIQEQQPQNQIGGTTTTTNKKSSQAFLSIGKIFIVCLICVLIALISVAIVAIEVDIDICRRMRKIPEVELFQNELYEPIKYFFWNKFTSSIVSTK